MKQRLLLIEDTATLQMIYSANLTSAGYAVDVATTGSEGLELFRDSGAQVVIMDMFLPDMDGIDVIKSFAEINPQAKIIAITSNGSVSRAVEAMRAGAFDFLVKPFSDERLLATVSSALANFEIKTDINLEAGSFYGFIGRGSVMQKMYRKILGVAPSSAPVFLTGECGISNENCARAIHNHASSNTRPFIIYNSRNQSASEQEKALFGGFDTSGTHEMIGNSSAFHKAYGGSLYINEVSELAPLLQLKLANLTRNAGLGEKRQNQQAGGFPRIICSTRTDPYLLLENHKISEDLFYQLHILTVDVPPLREIGDDIIHIAEAMLAQFSRTEQKSFVALSDEVSELFMSHNWPENMNQLENILHKVVANYDGAIVELDMLPKGFAIFDMNMTSDEPSTKETGRSNSAIQQLIGFSLEEVERKIIEATIHSQDGSVPKAADILGVAPSTIYRKKASY